MVRLTGLLSAMFALAGCRQDRPLATLPDPHHHIVNVHARPWTTELAPDVKFVEVKAPSAGTREKAAECTGWLAFVIESPMAGQPNVFREEIFFQSDGRTYRIDNVPLPYRPLDDLTWLSERYLVFDRWSQPHYGLHYVVDAQERRLVLVTPFPDSFYVDQQKENCAIAP